MRRHLVGLVVAGLGAALLTVPAATPARAGAPTYVPMTGTPNPAVAGQSILIQLAVGTLCSNSGIFNFYAVRANADPMHPEVITLGSRGTSSVAPSAIVDFRTNAIPAGVWEINADGQCKQNAADLPIYVDGNVVIETVRSRPAAQPPVAAAPKPNKHGLPATAPTPVPSPAAPSNSPNDQPVSEAVSSHLQASPTPVSPAWAGLFVALVVAAIGLLYARRRSRRA
ncbi:MAG TPA: hypothetical protein VI384_01560 [Candidatus Dormibacteraeota bacterium]